MSDKELAGWIVGSVVGGLAHFLSMLIAFSLRPNDLVIGAELMIVLDLAWFVLGLGCWLTAELLREHDRRKAREAAP